MGLHLCKGEPRRSVTFTLIEHLSCSLLQLGSKAQDASVSSCDDFRIMNETTNLISVHPVSLNRIRLGKMPALHNSSLPLSQPRTLTILTSFHLRLRFFCS